MTRCQNCGAETGAEETACRSCGVSHQPTQPAPQHATQTTGTGSDRGQRQHPGQSARQGRPASARGTTRRQLLTYGGGGAVAGVGLLWLVFGDGTGPAAITQDFFQALDRGDSETANDLLHESSPTAAVPEFTARAYDAAALTVENTTVTERTGEEATVEATLDGTDSDLFPSRPSDVTVDLRMEAGQWRLWGLPDH